MFFGINNNSDNDNDNNDDRKKKEEDPFDGGPDRRRFGIALVLCLIIVSATAFWIDSRKDNHFVGEGPMGSEDSRPEVILVEDDEDSEKDADDTKETGNIGKGKPKDDKKAPAKDSKAGKGAKSDKNIKDSIEKDKKAKKTPVKSSNKEDKTKEEKTDETGDTQDVGGVSITEPMAVPVTGKVSLPFADDKLVYHKTLNQWSTHKGIDIQAKEGAPVKAVLDGEIVEIINDSVMGISIAIKHEDGLLTVYSNLSTDSMVEEGERVKKGQVIGGVGKTSSVKVLEGPLLHFQVLKDDKFVDPELYLGKTSV